LIVVCVCGKSLFPLENKDQRETLSKFVREKALFFKTADIGCSFKINLAVSVTSKESQPVEYTGFCAYSGPSLFITRDDLTPDYSRIDLLRGDLAYSSGNRVLVPSVLSSDPDPDDPNDHGSHWESDSADTIAIGFEAMQFMDFTTGIKYDYQDKETIDSVTYTALVIKEYRSTKTYYVDDDHYIRYKKEEEYDGNNKITNEVLIKYTYVNFSMDAFKLDPALFPGLNDKFYSAPTVPSCKTVTPSEFPCPFVVRGSKTESGNATSIPFEFGEVPGKTPLAYVKVNNTQIVYRGDVIRDESSFSMFLGQDGACNGYPFDVINFPEQYLKKFYPALGQKFDYNEENSVDCSYDEGCTEYCSGLYKDGHIYQALCVTMKNSVPRYPVASRMFYPDYEFNATVDFPTELSGMSSFAIDEKAYPGCPNEAYVEPANRCNEPSSSSGSSDPSSSQPKSSSDPKSSSSNIPASSRHSSLYSSENPDSASLVDFAVSVLVASIAAALFSLF